jgi:hypothetical protein
MTEKLENPAGLAGFLFFSANVIGAWRRNSLDCRVALLRQGYAGLLAMTEVAYSFLSLVI